MGSEGLLILEKIWKDPVQQGKPMEFICIADSRPETQGPMSLEIESCLSCDRKVSISQTNPRRGRYQRDQGFTFTGVYIVHFDQHPLPLLAFEILFFPSLNRCGRQGVRGNFKAFSPFPLPHFPFFFPAPPFFHVPPYAASPSTTRHALYIQG